MNEATQALIRTDGTAITQAGGNRSIEQSAMGDQRVATADATSHAMAAQARAEVEARILAAKRWPRDWLDVRQRVLDACKRPGFAAVARYAVPRGGQTVTGWSVRFAEEVARDMGNIHTGSVVIYDDANTRALRVFAVDLEANTARETVITVQKTIERKSLKRGQTAIGTRVNSYGDQVYIVEATDDDLLTKQNALVSKAWRNLVLQLLPGDIAEEALDRVTETQEKGDAADPAAAVKKIADAFAAIGVKPSAIKDLLGHDLASCSPPEIARLRGIHTAIRSGETTWADIVREAGADDGSDGKPSAKAQAVIDAVAAEKARRDTAPAAGGAA